MSEFSGQGASQIFQGTSEMHARCQAMDWNQTSLEDTSFWQPSLRTIVQTVLACHFPSIILWGPDLIQIYNDGYREIMGNKHPEGLGQPTRACWPEAWGINESIFRRVMAGESLSFKSALYQLNRSGQLEDAWFDASYSPVMDERGAVGGVLVIVFETTDLVQERAMRQQAERHKAFMLSLSDALRPLADPHAIQLEAASLLGRFLGANRAGYAEAQYDSKLVAVTKNYTDGVESIEGIYTYSDYGPELYDRLAKGETVVRTDVYHDPSLSEAEKEAHAVLKLGATLNVPLVKAGQLIAILFVHFEHAREFPPEEIAMAEETAERTWSAVERARAEAELRVSEMQLSAIVNQASAGLARGLIDGTLTFVNQRYCQMLGYTADELIGSKMQDFTHPDDLTRNLELFYNLGKTGESFEIEKRYVCKDGSVIWVNTSVSALYDNEGNIDQLLAASLDITARKHAETALKESEQQYRRLSIELDARVNERTRQLELSVADLKRSNAGLQRFAYVASHDLQEPLRKILQFGGRLEESYGRQEQNGRFYLERMLSAAQRMTRLINDLLDFSRISSAPSLSDDIVLNELVNEVLDGLGAQVRVANLPQVKGDASQLHQLFQNLLSNGLKFHRPGEVPQIEIKVESVRADELPAHVHPPGSARIYHRIDVIDNGIGFDEQYLDRIFQMFQRLHGRSEFEGTGIGLAICETVAFNHGGAITANSRPNEGATFSVYLPATE
jgi:PAS domain S-box-containing protein